MTVTINTLGTNSRQIVIAGETSATNIIDGINTALTALGWTLYDTVTSGSRGLQTTKVYSAQNADTVTTKYMIIRYDLQRQYWFTSCCESWNTSTNVATNESWYYGRQILLPLQYSNCTLYVFATARYACFMGVIQSEPSAWQGVFEFERVASEDTSSNTVPCFGWTSSLTIGEPYGNFVTPVPLSTPTIGATSNANGSVAVGFAVPRTKNGFTGINALNVFTLTTALGTFPPVYGQVGANWSSGGITQTLNSHTDMLGAWGSNSSYVWDSNKTPISNIKLNGYTNLYLIGRIYGLKITVPLGSVLDTTTVPVDANLFYSEGGSNTTHYLLGIHGGYNDKLGVGSNRLSANVSTSGTAFGTPWQSVFVSGRYLYFTTTTGFHKYDVQTGGITLNVLPAAAYYAVKFDGENSLYVTGATANTVYKVNLTDDTYTSLTMTGSWSGLCLDDDNLYVGQGTTGSTVTVKRVALSTFTEAASYSLTTGSASSWITHMTCADYDGYVYVGIVGSRIIRIDRSAGTQSTLNATVVTWTVVYAQHMFYDGTYIWIMTNAQESPGSGGRTDHYRGVRIRQSDFTLNGEFSQSAPSSTFYPRALQVQMNTLGACEPPAFAGIQLISWGANDGSTTTAQRYNYSDPRIGLLAAVPCYGTTFDSTNPMLGQYSTDHCSLYVMSSTTKIVRYTNAFKAYNFNGVLSANILIAQ